MALRDLIGQDTVRQTLTGAIRRRQVPHAYLFVGPEGIGKEFTAVNLAKALNCGADSDACDQCRACQRVDSGRHPDVRLVRAEGASIKIDQIRQLQSEIILKPLEGKWKVYILPEAEKMTLEAANCLLKTLEEPPAHAVLILLTAQPAAVIPTVVSRCQILRFSLVPPATIEDLLRRVYGKTTAEAQLITALAGGITGTAIALATGGEFDRRRVAAVELMEEIARSGVAGLPDLARRMEKEGEGGREEYLDLLLLSYRDLLVWRETGEPSLLVNPDQVEYCRRNAGLYTRSELLDSISRIERTKRLIQQNVNPGLSYQALLLHLTRAG